MKVGTTPLIRFALDIDYDLVDHIIFTFKDELSEDADMLLQKNYPDDCEVYEQTVLIPLTQVETELFDGKTLIEAEIVWTGGNVSKTGIISKYFNPTLFTEYAVGGTGIDADLIEMTVDNLIVTAFPSTALPVVAVSGNKTIEMDDWETIAGERTVIDEITNPFLIPDGRETIDRGTFSDLMDSTSYITSDFTIYLSTDGETTTAYNPTSDTSIPARRTLTFDVGTEEIEFRISVNRVETYRSTEDVEYYLHDFTVLFSDYFRYDYTLPEITTKSKVEIAICNESVDEALILSGTLCPTVYDGYVRIETNQTPSGDIDTSYTILQTDNTILRAKILNVNGTAIYYDVSEDGVSNDGDNLVTEAQVKAYVDALIAAL